MVIQKPSTKSRYHPSLALTSDITAPSNSVLQLDGRLGEGVLSPALHQVLLKMARLRNIVSSLQIEGAKVGLEEARRVMDTGVTTSRREEEVLRFSKAYALLHNAKSPPRLTVDRILEFHREFFDGVVDPPIGALKTEPNGVRDRSTGAWIFHATPPKETEAELIALLKWYETDAQTLPPAVAAALFFVEFEAIHPFHDGNGRLGRFLNLIALKQFGLNNACLTPIDGRFFRTEDKYYESLQATNTGKNYHVWARYYAGELKRAYEIAVRRADLKPLLEKHTKKSTRELLHWVLIGDGGWFRHGEYPNPLDLSGTATSLSLGELVEEGVLEYEGEKKGRRYRLHRDFLARLYNADFLESERN